MKNIIGSVFSGLFLIFAIQNIGLVDIKFFMFHINQIPLFAVIITIFTLGVLTGRISGWFFRVMEHKPKKERKNKGDSQE